MAEDQPSRPADGKDDGEVVVAAGGSLRAILARVAGKKIATKSSATAVGYLRDPTGTYLRAAQQVRAPALHSDLQQ